MKEAPLYRQISDVLEHQIRSNVLGAGNKLPSLRTICDEHGVSMNTALQSYQTLESKGLIESRPQSGYYVSLGYKRMLATPTTSKPLTTCGIGDIEEVMKAVSANALQSRVLFSSGTPMQGLLPIAKLNKAMVQAMRELPGSGTEYSHRGNSKLQRLIAMRAAGWGGRLTEEDIVTTAGCMDALSFCMMSLAKPGDTIAVESPVYFGILRLARSIGLKVMELPTNATTGIEVDALKKALEHKKIKLCLLVSNFNNPLGSCMPDEHKKEVVRLMELHNVPLIEDDLYGELYFGTQRPRTCKTYDQSGIVLWCGSFSKTLAPGYRVGWVAPGKFKDQVYRTKWYHSVSTNTLAHEAVANFMEHERYDKHLQRLRRTLQTNMLHYQRCLAEYFPDDTRASRPEGGYIMWIELNKKIDVLELYDQAIRHKISIGPGVMYTLQQQYSNCFRMNYGLAWNKEVDEALKTLGTLTKRLLR